MGFKSKDVQTFALNNIIYSCGNILNWLWLATSNFHVIAVALLLLSVVSNPCSFFFFGSSTSLNTNCGFIALTLYSVIPLLLDWRIGGFWSMRCWGGSHKHFLLGSPNEHPLPFSSWMPLPHARYLQVQFG